MPAASSFPRFYAAASLKPHRGIAHGRAPQRFSAVLCRGLIEAFVTLTYRHAGNPFSAVLCRGLIEAPTGIASRGRSTLSFPRFYAAASLKRARARTSRAPRRKFSAVLCRGLIEAGIRHRHSWLRHRFPRFYAAASLKPHTIGGDVGSAHRFSAVLCRGLIEASRWSPRTSPACQVFRGFMPRPH